MKMVRNQKRRAAEQAELEALEAENDVEAIELEIQIVKTKGFIEQTFWRFPNIAMYKTVILEGMNSNGTCYEGNDCRK